jgi:hypothetical protein
MEDIRMAQTVQMMEEEEDEDEDEAFLRQLVLPEEDRRRRYPARPWTGGYRWFRSHNIIPIEQWRRRKRGNRATSPTSGTANQ